MAAGSRTVWSSLQRPVVGLRNSFSHCCRTNQLRLRSTEALEYSAQKGLFQRRGFWLFCGGCTSILGFTAYYNKLWEARQRRRLRVSVEGIGRFFRQVKILKKTCLFHSIPSFLRIKLGKEWLRELRGLGYMSQAN